ncbi:MAG: tRNA (adenosine(37)-N6)-threonylcarbamoyltransferase complex dimerization subunit type 1 TsaB [Oscillospiraceae bacterium]|nr:tRNA (adenosine(37)-N6)-threonylcarbamoyltransferase complex dimerization subunit type 1 TsaB [Oscillospiraceae bacterium]
MICMGIDSAGRSAGVAIMRDDDLLYEVSLNAGLTHSETLMELVDTAFKATGLTPAQVDLYGVCAGPGSFTGLRIGLALVKGLALPNNTPCAGVSTLQALALCHPAEGTVISALDARRGEVYWAAFNGADGARLTPDAAQKADQALEFAKVCKKPLFFVGDGAGLCYNKGSDIPGLVFLPEPCRASRALGICLAARQMEAAGLAVPPAELLPEYLRLSQAERERLEKNPVVVETVPDCPAVPAF